MAFGIWRCISEEVLSGIFSAAGVFSICRQRDKARLIRGQASRAHRWRNTPIGLLVCERAMCPRLDRSVVRACSEETVVKV